MSYVPRDLRAAVLDTAKRAEAVQKVAARFKSWGLPHSEAIEAVQELYRQSGKPAPTEDDIEFWHVESDPDFAPRDGKCAGVAIRARPGVAEVKCGEGWHLCGHCAFVKGYYR